MKRSVTALVLVLAACGRAEKSEPTSESTPRSPGAAPSEVAAAVVAAAAPAPAPAAPPKPAGISLAYLKDTELLECIDIQPAAGKEAEVEKVVEPLLKAGMTKLSQSCPSLGQVPLGTCAMSGMVRYVYANSRAEKGMASCLKGGGQWTTNKSPEAEMARAQQMVKALQ